MSKTKIPTAEEFIRNEWENTISSLEAIVEDGEHTKFCMIEFAKLHVKAALEKAAGEVVFDKKVRIRQSILQSYPESNIK